MDLSIYKKQITVQSQIENISKVVSELVAFVAGSKKIEEFTYELVLTEAVTNAIIHGNKSDPTKKVSAEAWIKPEQVIFQITDEGIGFKHDDLADPTKRENLYKQGGRGIFFIRYFMDEVKFNNTGNEITMTKYLNQFGRRCSR